ncbi:hypothetical protein YB2330_003399 [Saitoella coloradoensis]
MSDEKEQNPLDDPDVYQPHYSFWAPELKNQRRHAFKLIGLVLLLTTVFMWLTLPIYWGSYWQQPQNRWRQSVCILDLDSVASGTAAVLGPAIIQATTQDRQNQFHLGWTVKDLTTIPNYTDMGGSVWAHHAVQNQDCWAAVVIHSNATSAVLAAVNSDVSTYDPTGAMGFFYSEGRSYLTVDQWIPPQGISVLSRGLGIANAAFAAQVLTTVPTSIPAPAFGFSEYNVNPITHFAALPAVSIGMLYLLLYTFFTVNLWSEPRLQLQARLRLSSTLATRLLIPPIQYLFLSLWFSLVSLAWDVSFTAYFGHVGFFLFWMSNWVTMTALGFAIEGVYTLVGEAFIPFFFIAWIIANVSVAFVSIADQHWFYGYGYIMPIWNAVDAAKCVIFGTANHLGQDFGVNLGSVVGYGLGICLFTWAMRKWGGREG